MSCDTGDSVRICQLSGGTAVIQHTAPLQPHYAAARREVYAPYDTAHRAANKLQAKAERRLKSAGLPGEIAGRIRRGEPVDEALASQVFDALDDLWNDLSDAGESEREAYEAVRDFELANDTGEPVEPWELALDEYIGDGRVYDDILEWSPEFHLDGAKYNETTFRIVRPGFAVARVVGEGRGVLLLKDDGNGWTLIGAYRGIDLGILPEYQGMGLSYYLVVEKGRANGGVPVGGGYSPAGLAAHRSAHRRAVEEAFRQGKINPHSSLADRHYRYYPELKDRFAGP